jgi:hypothetical protein
MAATESTTTADPQGRSDVSRYPADRGAVKAVFWSRLTSLLLGIIALFLVFLAWPRLHASLLYLPVDTAIGKFYETREIPSEQLEGLQQRALDSIVVYPHHRYLEGLSLLYFLEAADSDNLLHRRREAFENAITAAGDSLRRAPAQPRTWLRIAQARAWLRYPPEQVIEALKMAIYTGRVEPSMFMTRLALGLSYLPRMDGEGQAMMRDQVLLAWQLRPNDVRRALREETIKFAAVERLLSGAHEGTLEEIRNGTAR